MKEGGALFPSNARMFLAPIRTNTANQKYNDFEDSCGGWDNFVDDTRENYGVDMSALTDTFEKEQREFFLNTSAWVDINPSQLLGAPCVVKEYDLNVVTLEEMKSVDAPFSLTVLDAMGNSEVGAFAGWFDVHFKGSKQNPCETEVELTTAPDANGATHWGQQAFYLERGIKPSDGGAVWGRLEMKRKRENQRLYDLKLTWEQGEEQGKPNEEIGESSNVWHIE